MSNWIYFVLIAQLIWSFTSLIDKIVISRGYIKNPAVYIVLNGLMNVLLIFLLPFVGFEPLKFTDFLVALASGALFSAAVALYYKAVQHEEISRIIMLNQLSPIFVLIFSFLFLNELLTKNHFIGFSFLMGAGMIVAYKKTAKFKLNKAFWYMLSSAFLSAISLVLAKHIFNVTSFWRAFLWLRLCGFTALAVLIVPSIRYEFFKTFNQMKNSIKSLLSFKILIDFSAFTFAGYALLNGRASLVSALSSSIQPIIVFAITLFTSIYIPKLVKEEIDAKVLLTKLLAILFIIIGIVFVNL